jgi:4-hydroxy-tetrahydrodipicolinate synthase
MKQKKYHGVVVPAVTPLTSQFQLDPSAVEKMFANFNTHHVHPFILGTTGEATSIPNNVKQQYIKTAIQLKKQGTTLYAGISSNCLQESIDFAKDCFYAGVDAVAATLPSYYTLTEGQMKQYFEQLADAIKAPLIIYNIPATTHMSIPLSVIDALSHHEYIVAVKDSEKSEERIHASLSLWKDRPDFSYFLGWAGKSAEAMLNGSDGLIPSTGNLIPSIYDQLQQAVAAGDKEKAYEMQRINDLIGNLYQGGKTLGESLYALKRLMRTKGLCQAIVMPPLQAFSVDQEQILINNWNTILEQEELVF